MSTTTQRLGLFKYDTAADSQVPFNIDDALNYNWDIIDQKVGPNRNVGEIIASSLPLTDAGLHLLDGALILGDGIYSEFVEYIAQLYTNNPDANYFTDETTWQQSITDYGSCGKFVYDSTLNTVRLPKVSDILQGTTDVSALGDLIEAGLPNITGSCGNFRCGGNVASGALYLTSSASVGGGTGGAGFNVNIDASRSNSIYDNSNTVQPQTIKVLYYIVVATATKTDIQVDIDEIATDLNGKVDKSNLSEVYPVIEAYSYGTSWYRIYSDGFCEQGGRLTRTVAGLIDVSLLKNYVNTNYNIQATIKALDSYDASMAANSVYVLQQTISTFKLSCSTAIANLAYFTWEAKGYIG